MKKFVGNSRKKFHLLGSSGFFAEIDALRVDFDLLAITGSFTTIGNSTESYLVDIVENLTNLPTIKNIWHLGELTGGFAETGPPIANDSNLIQISLQDAGLFRHFYCLEYSKFSYFERNNRCL